jgi:hypothetical protein
MNLEQFLHELSRRNVYKVAITYSVVAWLLIQIASLILAAVEAPGWVLATLIVLFAIGLIISLMISWAFEATPEGLKRTEKVPRDASLPTWSPRKYATFVITVGLMAACLLAYQLLRPHAHSSPSPTTPDQEATPSGLTTPSS